MSDFFKSAFGYLSSGGTKDDNDFVGQYVELGEQKLRVKRVIAEGSFFYSNQLLYEQNIDPILTEISHIDRLV